MTDIQTWLDQGKTLAGQATEGPWFTSPFDHDPVWGSIVTGGVDEHEEDLPPCIEAGDREDATFIADARTRLPQALNALQAVHDLHKPVTMIGNADFSTPLDDYNPDEYDVEMSTFEVCAECWAVENEVYQANECVAGGLRSEWPCPTVRAIQDAIGDQA